MSGPLAIAVLAAGKASRFGGGKLDADLRGKRLGAHALEAAKALDQGPIMIVIGDPVPAFVQEAGGAVQILPNPRASEGIGTSVATVARHAQGQGCMALLLLAADMPFVNEHTLRRLVDASAPGVPAAVIHPDGHPGIPACFPREWFDQLKGLGGDRGAASLLRRAKTVRLIATPAGELVDVDSPDDLLLISGQKKGLVR